MDLQNKAKWHLDVNGGYIPVLETPDGQMIHESAVIQDMAVDWGEGMPLWPHEKEKTIQNVMLTAKHKLQMQKFTSFLSKFWPANASRYQDQDAISALKSCITNEIEPFFIENMQGAPFLSGTSEPMMIDIHCFPFVERMVMIENSPWHHGYLQTDVAKNAPTVYDYVHRFRKHEVMSAHVIDPECYGKHLLRQNAMPVGQKAMLSVEVFK